MAKTFQNPFKKQKGFEAYTNLMKPAYVIGIDIGTGSTKAVALNATGEVLATAQQHYSPLPAPPGRYEQGPNVIWQALVQCLNDVVQQLQAAPAMVSFSACMHSLLAVDKEGKPLTHMITWADARSQAIADALRQSPTAEELYKATGTPLHSMSPLTKIIWFCQKEKERFSQAAKWISIKEYIWFQLFGVYEVDVSIATASGLMDIHQFSWYEPALALAQISPDQLSTIKPTTFMRSKVQATAKQHLQVEDDTLFCIGSSDGCMANLGSGAVHPGIGALTIGTSSAVRVAVPKPVLAFSSMLFNYPINEHTFICGGPLNNGGNMVHWAIKKMQALQNPTQKDYERFYTEVGEITAGSQGLICLPYFIGERAPVWDERSSGVFLGVKAYHTPAHFHRAVLEGVCFALYDVLQQVEEATGTVQQLNVSGGFIRSEVWLQMLADITGKKLCIVTTEDASATGAALLAMGANGWIKTERVGKDVLQTINPQKEQHALYQSYFNIYKTLYPSLQQAMHQLYALQLNNVEIPV